MRTVKKRWESGGKIRKKRSGTHGPKEDPRKKGREGPRASLAAFPSPGGLTEVRALVNSGLPPLDCTSGPVEM